MRNLKNPVFKFIYKYFKRKEKEFLLESDVIISLTNNAKEEIEKNIISTQQLNHSTDQQLNLPGQQVGISKTPHLHIQVIPTCADLELFNPNTVTKAETQGLREKLGIHPDDFVLLYLGSLGTWYMLEEMLDFYENL